MKATTYINYLKYVFVHKYWVYVEGRKLGVGRYQLFMHDMTKFAPIEFFSYARWFNERPAKDTNREGHDKAKEAFLLGWNHHIHNNKHHWQYWMINRDSGGVDVMRMPEKYAREMVADWEGVAKTKGFGSAKEWYIGNGDTMSLHPQTRNRVEALLKLGEPPANIVTVDPPRKREPGV